MSMPQFLSLPLSYFFSSFSCYLSHV
ncbi:hypothetical protein M3J09_000264 [Ascochyta lentis]